MTVCRAQSGARQDGEGCAGLSLEYLPRHSWLSPCPPCLQPAWLLAQFGPQRVEAQRLYCQVVLAGVDPPSLWSDLKGQIFLAQAGFIATMAAHLKSVRTV